MSQTSRPKDTASMDTRSESTRPSPGAPMVRVTLAAWLLLTAVGFGRLDANEPPTTAPAASEDPLARIPTLKLADLEEWRQAIVPSAEENLWLEIPWLASFGEGLHRAARADKPVLLWVMNGHPLGCT